MAKLDGWALYFRSIQHAIAIESDLQRMVLVSSAEHRASCIIFYLDFCGTAANDKRGLSSSGDLSGTIYELDK